MNTNGHELSFSFDALVDLCRQTHDHFQGTVARAANTALAVRNWLFGWYIVEYEQKGADRAEIYGKRLIEGLAVRLRNSGLRGASMTNLRKFRDFYNKYPEIRQTLSVESVTSLLLDTSEIRQTVSAESLPVIAVSPAMVANLEHELESEGEREGSE